MRVSVEGSRYALERKLRARDDWKAIAASDNREVMQKLFDDQRRFVKTGQLQLVDRATGRVLGHWHRPDLAEPKVETRPDEPPTVVEVKR